MTDSRVEREGTGISSFMESKPPRFLTNAAAQDLEPVFIDFPRRSAVGFATILRHFWRFLTDKIGAFRF